MLVGRSRELEVLRGVIDDARDGRPSSVLVRGAAGIGKTSLLDAAAAAAGDVTELRVTGVEAEQDLELAGYVALFGPALDSTDGLDPRVGQLLEALMVSGQAPPPLALGLATLHLLALLADRRPLLVVVDDVQWVDAATLAALRFGFRRLGPDRVALVGAARGHGPAMWSGQPTLDLSGLDAVASALVLDEVGGVAHEVAAACHARSGGNPLVLQRIAAELGPEERRGVVPLPAVLPMGDDLLTALSAELAGIPESSRVALRCAALAGRLHLSELRSALEILGVGLDDLRGPELSGVIRLDPAGVEFGHPLQREAAARGPVPEARVIHAALADVASGDRRAWHLAEAWSGEDDRLSAVAVEALEQVAHDAGARGAHAAAALAWTRAAELRPDPAGRAECLLAAGSAWASADVPHRAEPALWAALEDAAPAQRARVVWVLGEVLAWSSSVAAAARLMREEAERVGPVDTDGAALLMAGAAGFLGLKGDVTAGLELAGRADGVAGTGPEVQVVTRLLDTHLRVLRGDGPDVLGDRWAELDAVRSLVVPGAAPDVLELAQLVAFDDLSTERWDTADDLLHSITGAARAGAQVSVLNFASAMRAELLWRRGRWSDARAWAMEDVAHFQAVDGKAGAFGLAVLARVEAALGLGDTAAGLATTARVRGEAIEMGVLTAWGRHAEALCALAAGRPADAADHLGRIWDLCRAGGIGSAGALWWHGDLLEALTAIGRRDEARRLLRWLEGCAPAGSVWPLAVRERGAGLLDGDVAAAGRSVDLLDGLGAPFEAARSRLVLAGLLVGGERAAVLEQAADSFAQLGAGAWEARARALGAEGPADHEPALAAALSRAELRVALVVGRGATNRQTADELALSEKTVDAHLQSIYRKLGIRSRTELALRVARDPRC
ncbi:MAG: AAA family ATPase [Microthrixaceae bacterium]